MRRAFFSLARQSSASAIGSAKPRQGLRAFANHVDLPPSAVQDELVGGAISNSDIEGGQGRGRKNRRRRTSVVEVEDHPLKVKEIPEDAAESLRPIYESLAKLPPRPAPLSALRRAPGLPSKHQWTQGRNPVFFPNITMTMVRPSPKEAHDPYLAIFHCSLQLSKIDIYNYLRQIYGLDGITSIRTAIKRSRFHREYKQTGTGLKTVTRRRRAETYKKVWIGLSEPFFFPPARSAAWLDHHYRYSFAVNAFDWGQKAELDRAPLWSPPPPFGANDRGYRPDILGAVLAQRQRRNRALEMKGREERERRSQSVVEAKERDPSKEAAPFKKGPLEAAMDAELEALDPELTKEFEKDEEELRFQRAKKHRRGESRGQNDTLIDFETTRFSKRFVKPRL